MNPYRDDDDGDNEQQPDFNRYEEWLDMQQEGDFDE
jgi:hypothetical protein